uniref:Armadillo repeat-containing domain-containing protein n=1 Tax=Rhodosorus marinus TaxID=101924 RepID=A0A7S3E814_9RHOD|mmetsp:Transcript_16184/g.66962  ORF Transcript_16184/g.66962 Transcript_16184/m.66962 type:complete len:501 (+) Transcript_16184:296-1798(+)
MGGLEGGAAASSGPREKMESLETFLVAESLDWQPQVNSKVALVNSESVLMSWFANRMGSSKSSVELERGLHVCAVVAGTNKDFGKVFVDVVTVPKTVELVHKHKNDGAIQKKLMFLISLLASDETLRENLCEGGMGEAVLAVMNRHFTSNVTVLERSTLALSKLTAASLDVKLRIAAAGGLRILAEVLKVHGDSQALVRTSAHAIRNLTLNCPENVLLSKQLGIPKLLLLRTSGASEATRIQLLLTLGHITRCDEELQKQFGNDVDYCVPIAKIVKDAPDSEKLSELSVEMLSVVANGRNEEILNMLGESAFISVLLKRQDQFSDNVNLNYQVCKVLRGMAFTRVNRELLRRQGGIGKTIEVMHNFSHEVDVVEQCLCVLSNACYRSVENQECLGKSSGIQETLRAMEIHRDKVQIQDRGCRALRNFADSCEYNIRLEGTAGAVEGLVLAMLSFPESQEVNEQAVAALLNITKHEKNFLVMVEKDVVDIVRKARQVRIFF